MHESSPYLLQHSQNPVDWYAWGDDALRRAREEDKPILLSIGYSACHWCHVMAHESFEDAAIARIMNENFVNIKVDREERPDLDAIYMQAVQTMTGHGGWPLTAFLTPDGEPFYGGTYFPPEERPGMPAFPRVLQSVAEAYRTKKQEIVRSARQLVDRLQDATPAPTGVQQLTEDILRQAYVVLQPEFDGEQGGFGAAPKFPQPMVYDYLLRYQGRMADTEALSMAELTLTNMARGGIYDQVGGGFHRYSTDAQWLVPHFEKMLYDNALLSQLYLHAYQATGNPLYRSVAVETLEYVQREMTSPEGGFYSTQDADSEGEEGKFYVWTPQEIDDVLGREDGAVCRRYFGVSEQGNFEGHNILHIPRAPEAVAQEIGMGLEQLEAVVQRARARLYSERAERTWPARDEKILTGWNGLMLQSFAEAAAILGRDDYRQVAEVNAAFILERLRHEGRLLRSYKDGQAKVLGYLEDYSFLIDGLLSVYEATFQRRWLDEARSLAEEMVALFWDAEKGVFFDTGHDHESLVARPRDVFDNAIPSGSSVAVSVLLRLGVFFDDEDFRRRAAIALRSVADFVARFPTGMGRWLCALDFYLSMPQEIAIVGRREEPATKALLEVVFGQYLPNKVVAGCDPGDAEGARGIPLLLGREQGQQNLTAYVCQNYACQFPTAEPETLAEQLAAGVH